MKLYEAINVLKKLYEDDVDGRVHYENINGTGFKSLPYNKNMVNPIIDCFLSNELVSYKKNEYITPKEFNIKKANKIVGKSGFELSEELGSCCNSTNQQNTLAALILYNAILQKQEDPEYFNKYNNKKDYEKGIEDAYKNLSDKMKKFSEFKEEIGFNKKSEEEKPEEKKSEEEKPEKVLPSENKKEVSLDNEIDYENWDKFLPHDEEENYSNYDELAKIRSNIKKGQDELRVYKNVLKTYEASPKGEEKNIKEVNKKIKELTERLQKLITKYTNISNKKD